MKRGLSSNSSQELHVFQVGDLVSNQNGLQYVIVEILNTSYRFMNLQDNTIIAIGEHLIIKKGDISTQPFEIFDKYNYLFQFKK